MVERWRGGGDRCSCTQRTRLRSRENKKKKKRKEKMRATKLQERQQRASDTNKSAKMVLHASW